MWLGDEWFVEVLAVAETKTQLIWMVPDIPDFLASTAACGKRTEQLQILAVRTQAVTRSVKQRRGARLHGTARDRHELCRWLRLLTLLRM